MPCFRPLTGYRSKCVGASGKRAIVFSRADALDPNDPVTLPCGQCRFCRLEHSRQWALRCFHEASLYDRNCFLTLTYRDEFLPRFGSLDYNAPVLFMKRLRERFGSGIRSFGCAEYGELLARPHYHICLFNFDFEDKVLFKRSGENSLYVSESLNELWPFGFATVGALTFESAAYVARYVTKKCTGRDSGSHYECVDGRSGEVGEKAPERSVCVSRRPGIGREWYEKFGAFVREHDFVVLRGRRVRPAKYYDRLFDVFDPEGFALKKLQRARDGEKASLRLSDEDRVAFAAWAAAGGLRGDKVMPRHRLTVLEDVQELKFDLLKRGLENG